MSFGMLPGMSRSHGRCVVYTRGWAIFGGVRHGGQGHGSQPGGGEANLLSTSWLGNQVPWHCGMMQMIYPHLLSLIHSQIHDFRFWSMIIHKYIISLTPWISTCMNACMYVELFAFGVNDTFWHLIFKVTDMRGQKVHSGSAEVSDCITHFSVWHSTKWRISTDYC